MLRTTRVSSFASVVMIFQLSFENTVTIILTLWIGVKRFRQSASPLVKVLYRDGAFYFIYTFCECRSSEKGGPTNEGHSVISAGNIVVLVAGPVGLSSLLFSHSTYPLSTARIPRPPEYVRFPLQQYQAPVYVSSHSFQRVMHSILSTRTVLHVRTIAAQQGHMDSSAVPISEARFERGQDSSENSETLLLSDVSRREQSVPG